MLNRSGFRFEKSGGSLDKMNRSNQEKQENVQKIINQENVSNSDKLKDTNKDKINRDELIITDEDKRELNLNKSDENEGELEAAKLDSSKSNITEIDIDKFNRIAQEIRWNAEGLVPAVVQDAESAEVLMLAYMNKEALYKTLTEGKAVYYSRSRQSLWLKGETSGNYQQVVDIFFDCDKDALLLKVKQTGMACHENYFSCFHYRPQPEAGKSNELKWDITSEPNIRPALSLGRTLEILAEVIKDRKQEKTEGSYTAYLFTKGKDKILKKVGEECAEVIIAAKNSSLEEIRYEAADLFYHLLVLFEEMGLNLTEIAEELNARRK